jgi:hypothetical protein
MPGHRDPPDSKSAARHARLDRRLLQEEAEQVAEEMIGADTDLADYASELMGRSSLVRVGVASRTFEGQLVHVGEDLLRLVDHAENVIDVALDAVTQMRLMAPREGDLGRPATAASTFGGRLRELAATNEEVELGGNELVAVTGRIRVVAIDHVRVAMRDGSECAIRLGAIDYVLRRPRAERR